jgi:hypothetical protein
MNAAIKMSKSHPVKTASVGFMLLLAGAFSQAPKKIDPWLINNAQIGPNPIEMPVGSSYTARVEYPNPDGPMSPLKAKVAWSISPVAAGISIDPISGKITVAAGVPAGTTAVVHADINDGVRKISAKLLVFNPADIPLYGDWTIQKILLCDETKPYTPPGTAIRVGEHWRFYADHKIYIGRPMGIAATTKLIGDYQLDLKSSIVKVIATWPKGKPDEEWKFEIPDAQTMKLTLPAKDEKSQVCGYVVTRGPNAN